MDGFLTPTPADLLPVPPRSPLNVGVRASPESVATTNAATMGARMYRFFFSCTIFLSLIDGILATELRQICQSFARCLELRDKYMNYSLQRLGDNPRDHDGVFQGFSTDIGGVNGVRPDAWHELLEKTKTKPPAPQPVVTGHTLAMIDPAAAAKQTAAIPGLNARESQFKPWQVYPKPPPPYTMGALGTPADEEFILESLEIPGKAEVDGVGLEFEINPEGIFQVYQYGAAGESELNRDVCGADYTH